jgi:hypothetical protein
MDETIFRDEVNDAVLFRDLHGNGEVVCGLRWEVDINSFLDERRIGSRVVNFNNMKLCNSVSLAEAPKLKGLTLAPVAVRTAKLNNFVGF